MSVVQLADRLGNIKKKRLGFSIPYLFLGPIYLLVRFRILSFLLMLICTYYFLPIPYMNEVVKFFRFIGIPNQIMDHLATFLMFFRGAVSRYFGIAFYAFLHLWIASFIEGRLFRRVIKRKRYLPVSEKDARILVKYNAAKITVPLAESFDIRSMSGYKSAEANWYEANQTRLKKGKNNSTTFINTLAPLPNKLTESELSKVEEAQIQLEQLQNVYNLGLLTREQYEIRRKKILDGKK